LVAGGLMADAIYQGAELQKEAFLSWWHSGMSDTPGSMKMIRDLLQNSSAMSGFSFKDVGEASENIFRLMKGTPNNGLDAAPELLRAGATESLIKKTSLQESVKSIVEMAHMMGVYDPDKLKAMAPIIGFLSTLNPASLPQFGRSASYSVPTLSNALGIHAADVLFANTAIARAGATGSKSGTWIEHMFDRALPPDPHTLPKGAYQARLWAMRQAGLVDANGKSTILGANGGIDIETFLNTSRAALEKLDIGTRNSVEKAVFGEQGARGYELSTSPVVMEQMRKLKAEMPDFAPKYNAFLEQFSDRSTIQKARTTYAEFNNLLADIGDKILPGVNRTLGQFSAILKGIKDMLPGSSSTKEEGMAVIGNRAILAAGAGALYGAAGGPGGAILGGLGGGVLGAAEGYMEEHNKPWHIGFDPGGSYTSPGKTGKPAQPKVEVQTPPQSFSLMLDSELLAKAIIPKIVSLFDFETTAPASDGSVAYGP
jgi:hypothetical protein